jgi:hypothetical protein
VTGCAPTPSTCIPTSVSVAGAYAAAGPARLRLFGRAVEAMTAPLVFGPEGQNFQTVVLQADGCARRVRTDGTLTTGRDVR